MIKFNWKLFSISQQVVREMMLDRGYTDIEGEIETEEEFKNTELPIVVTALYNDKRVYVFWFREKIDKGRMNLIINTVDEEDAHRVIIVANNGLTPKTNQALKMQKELYDVFSFTETQINPTKHVLVPKHEKLNDDEVQRLMEEYKITNKSLPKIDVADTIVRWYDWPKNTIILQRCSTCIRYMRVA